MKKTFDNFDLDKFSEKLRSESDRACAVLAAALLDAKLKVLFEKKMLSFQKELIQDSGPLSSFSVKIRLAHALAWINDDAEHDLDIIRKIRNEFAHNFDHEIAFSDKFFSDRCLSLRSIAKFMEGLDEAAKEAKNVSPSLFRDMRDVFKPTRMRFEVSVSFLSQYLDEITVNDPIYTGSDLLRDLYDLGASVRVNISATGTGGSQASDADGK